MDNRIEYNFSKLIEEIQICCNNRQYFAALSTALILPDICSKIESKYGTAKKDGKPYIIWCNKWLCQYLYPISTWSQYEGSWGQVIYKLRCGILHSGEVDVCDKEYTFFDLKSFNFFVDNDSRYRRPLTIAKVQKTGGCGYSNTAKIDIDIHYLICAIISGTLAFIDYYHLDDEDISFMAIQRDLTKVK